MKYLHTNKLGRFYRFNTVLEAQDFVQMFNGKYVKGTKYVRL